MIRWHSSLGHIDPEHQSIGSVLQQRRIARKPVSDRATGVWAILLKAAGQHGCGTLSRGRLGSAILDVRYPPYATNKGKQGEYTRLEAREFHGGLRYIE